MALAVVSAAASAGTQEHNLKTKNKKCKGKRCPRGNGRGKKQFNEDDEAQLEEPQEREPNRSKREFVGAPTTSVSSEIVWSSSGPPGPAVLPASAGRTAEAGEPVFELIRAKLIQIRDLRARLCSRPPPAARRMPGTPYLN